MALATNIHELINGRVIEWERLEFKKSWNPNAVLHTLCAFANDINNWGGGYIIIGIEENKGRPILPPTGLESEQIDKIQGEIIELCRMISPNYMPIIQPYLFQDKHILVVYAPSGELRPYSAPEGVGERGLQKRFNYIRIGSRTIKAQGEELRRLQELAARIPYDDRQNNQAQLNDLNLGLIREYLQEIGSDLAEECVNMPFEDLCRQMNIVRGPQESIRPINVGLLFFNRSPENFFNRAWIEIVLREDEAGKTFSEKYFKGPLHIQLREALSFIRTNIIEERIQKLPNQAEAKRFFNYPYEAVEEALANAVFHKSYELGNPIEVQIWPDKIEILSFPGPVPPVDSQILAENKRIVARDYRNRRVGDFLKELNLTEGRGTGIPTIRKALEKNESPQATFETNEQCTYFLTIIPINLEFLHPSKALTSNQESNQEILSQQFDSQHLIELLSAFGNQQSNQESNQEIMRFFGILYYSIEPRSRAEILDHLGITNQFKNYQKHIEPLILNGLLGYIFPENPRHRNQKYLTTDLGKSILKKNMQ